MSVAVGVVPSGVGRRLHSCVLARLPQVTLRRVRLPRIDLGQGAISSDWHGLMRDVADLDLFIVGTPPHCQLQHAEHLIRAGIPVLCEKPAGITDKQALRLAAVADEVGVDCRVNYQLRFDPFVRVARSVIETHSPDSVEITCISDARRTRSGKPTWYWHPESGGGVWFSLLSHLIDLAHYLGLWIIGLEATRAKPEVGPMRGIDALTVQAHCASDRHLTLIVDALAESTALTIIVRNAREMIEFDLTTGKISSARGSPTWRDPRPAGPWRAAFGHCADSLFAREQVSAVGCATLQDAINVHQVIEIVRAQL